MVLPEWTTESLTTSADGNIALFLAHNPERMVADCVVGADTSWTSLAPLFPNQSPCPWCKKQLPAAAPSCSGCGRSFEDLYRPKATQTASKSQTRSHPTGGISQARIAECITQLSNSHSGGEYSDGPVDEWRDCTKDLIRSGPGVLPAVLAAMGRISSYGYFEAAARFYFLDVIKGLWKADQDSLKQEVQRLAKGHVFGDVMEKFRDWEREGYTDETNWF